MGVSEERSCKLLPPSSFQRGGQLVMVRRARFFCLGLGLPEDILDPLPFQSGTDGDLDMS